jgi:hypothetical protein
MNDGNALYAFVLRGDVAQDAVDRELMRSREGASDDVEALAARLPFDLLPDDAVQSARKMAAVYTAIAAFENAARKFIQDRLLEEVGANWWDTVPSAIQKSAEKRKEEEDQIRWHGARGASLIYYTQLGDLANILQNNTEHFKDHIESVEWARQIFRSLERSRNVIMHSGELSMNDLERVAMNIRDWLRQVGG